jgi:hypothetical protein
VDVDLALTSTAVVEVDMAVDVEPHRRPPEGAVADHLAPLCRDGVVRLCSKPPADPRAPVGAR